ncbi:MAG: SAM-dependent methyltransferase [Zoogloeaceae bacterium]|jgi:hypothetical protein|nr:SAM-dependent methyltransferase [Zoogloeaceae bacterium]
MKNTSPSLPPEIRPGQSVALLKTLHILTRDGKLNQDARRKLKQVYHLCNFLAPLLAELAGRDFYLVDHGAGKSYLSFILYDLFLKERPEGQVIGIETRAELVANAQKLAATLAFERMAFFCRTVEAATTMPEIPDHVDMVTALHACDTATDDAIRFALAKSARFIALIPCCQAEVAAELRRRKNESFTITPFSELWRHPIHTREFGSHVTNVLRCLLLTAHGYQVRVTELVGWEHSMKNELIIAQKIVPETTNPSARNRAEALLASLNLENLRERFVY